MIYVTDRGQLNTFCNNPNNSGFFERNGSLFKSGSVWDTAYNQVRDKLLSDGYTQNDAQSYALSYVLDNYKTGMKVYEMNKAQGSYKEQKTEK